MPRRVTLRFCERAGAAKAIVARNSKEVLQPRTQAERGSPFIRFMRETIRTGQERLYWFP